MSLRDDEIEIIRRMANGESVKQIAFERRCGTEAIYTKVREARSYARVNTDPGLVAWAMREGIIS